MKASLTNFSSLITALVVICLFLPQLAQAQAEFRKYSNNFLSIGVGGRAHGMGGAVSATSSNVFSTQWNPAGLAQGQTPLSVAAMHAEWFAGVVNYDFIGIAKGIKPRQESLWRRVSRKDGH